MDKRILFFKVIILFAFFLQFSLVRGQFIVGQIEQEIPISYELIPEDIEFETQEDELDFFLNIPLNELKEAAIHDGAEVIEETSTIYIDGEYFAVESESEEMGRISMVSNTQTGIMNTIMWSQKKVIEMKPEDMQDIQKKADAAMEDAIKDMPPEMQEQIRAEMAKENNTSPVEYDPQPTGEKMDLFGFSCEEYRVYTDEEVVSIWVADDAFGIVDEIKKVSINFDELFQIEEEKGIDEWELIPNKIPVQIRTFTSSMMMGEPIVSVQTITKIEKQKPPADKFRIPGEDEGFTKTTITEMMEEMMPEE